MTTENIKDLPLGKDVEYCDQYSPELLFPIARQSSRESLGVTAEQLPFTGEDIWNAYEVSWLNSKGLPQVACAEFRVPCDSYCIIESKSFKLYLNSFNQSKFADWAQVEACMQHDLSVAAGATVSVKLRSLNQMARELTECPGILLDEQDIEISGYQVDADLLQTGDGDGEVTEQLHSHLLRSLCPVTGQPDWGSLVISYSGLQIDHQNLLRYIVGFRRHQDFHEHCVERIFVDLLASCKPSQLSVYARYVRRGGLDINPFRSIEPVSPENFRLSRQ